MTRMTTVNESSAASTGTGTMDISSPKSTEKTNSSNNKKRRRQQLNDNDNTNDTNDNTIPGSNGHGSVIKTVPVAVPVVNIQVPYKSNHYNVSYMHQSVVTCSPITSMKHGYVITGDSKGIVKFWKRIPVVPFTGTGTTDGSGSSKGKNTTSTNGSCCVEFVKSFIAHAGSVQCLCIDNGGDTVVSIGSASSASTSSSAPSSSYVIKWYDVVTFDVTHLITTTREQLGYCSTLFTTTGDVLALAVSSVTNADIYIYAADQPNCIQTIQLHASSSCYVTCLLYIPHYNCIVSTDTNGIVEVWDCIRSNSALTTATSTSSNSKKHQATNANDTNQYANDFDTDDNTNTTFETAIDDNEQQKQYMLSIGCQSDYVSNKIKYKTKFDTDYILLLKKKVYPIAVTYTTISQHGGSTIRTYYAMYCSDRKIRIFDHSTGKLYQTIDDRLQFYDTLVVAHQDDTTNGDDNNNQSSSPFIRSYYMDHMEYGKRIAVEREIQNETTILSGPTSSNKNTNKQQAMGKKSSYHQLFSIQFDVSGQYLYVPTLLGIVIWDWQKRSIVSILGSADSSTIRFVSVCIAHGNAKLNQQIQLARNEQNGTPATAVVNSTSTKDIKNNTKTNKVWIPNDALIITTAYEQRRIYIFSHYDPIDDESTTDSSGTGNNKKNVDSITIRDVWNEPPTAQDQLFNQRGNFPSASTVQQSSSSSGATTTSPSNVVLRTTMGDIYIQLYPELVPKTIENFIGHIKTRYYDNVIFHRVIPKFMLQTGDPLGDGTGGESIWGNEFEDEIVSTLKHDSPFIVSMANAGPNTNGSQFFITTVPAPWLDGKHTIFGRVIKGMDICTKIEHVPTDSRNDKPIHDIRIVNIDILD